MSSDTMAAESLCEFLKQITNPGCYVIKIEETIIHKFIGVAAEIPNVK